MGWWCRFVGGKWVWRMVSWFRVRNRLVHWGMRRLVVWLWVGWQIFKLWLMVRLGLVVDRLFVNRLMIHGLGCVVGLWSVVNWFLVDGVGRMVDRLLVNRLVVHRLLVHRLLVFGFGWVVGFRLVVGRLFVNWLGCVVWLRLVVGRLLVNWLG
jgi:hypothetical protein